MTGKHTVQQFRASGKLDELMLYLNKMVLAAYELECAGLVLLTLLAAFWMDPPIYPISGYIICHLESNAFTTIL